ncbi:unnamed protein product, partial [Closterium sp. Naga37s-1]
DSEAPSRLGDPYGRSRTQDLLRCFSYSLAVLLSSLEKRRKLPCAVTAASSAAAEAMWDGEEEEDDKVCHTRAEYRAGRRERAVRVYTVNDESRYLMVRNVPALGCVGDLLRLFSAHGPIEEHRMMDEEDAPAFTDVVWLKFTHLHHARFAKRKLDEYPFMGSALKVSYLPGHEAMEDTWAKLEERRRIVAVRCRRLAEEQAGSQTGGGQDGNRARQREAPAGTGEVAHAAAAAAAAPTTPTAAASAGAVSASRAATPVVAAVAARAGSIPPLAPLPPPRPQAPPLPVSGVTALPPPPRLQPTRPHQQPAKGHEQHVAAAGSSRAVNTDTGSDMVTLPSSRHACSTPLTSATTQQCGSNSSVPQSPHYFGVPSMDAAVARVRSHLAALHAPPHPHSTPPIHLLCRSQLYTSIMPLSHCYVLSPSYPKPLYPPSLVRRPLQTDSPPPAVVLQTQSQCAPSDSASERAVAVQPTKKKLLLAKVLYPVRRWTRNYRRVRPVAPTSRYYSYPSPSVSSTSHAPHHPTSLTHRPPSFPLDASTLRPPHESCASPPPPSLSNSPSTPAPSLTQSSPAPPLPPLLPHLAFATPSPLTLPHTPPFPPACPTATPMSFVSHLAVPPGRCISQGGQWPPFWLHGKLPRKSPKGGAQELTLCRVYKDRTCCGRENSDHALISTRRLVVGGEPTDDCISKWEALQCATCHPLIGTQHGPPAICNSFCDAVFSACGAAFFAADGTSQHIFPCGRRDTLCARADSLASSGRQFCQLAGFDWLPDSHGAGVDRRGGRGEEMGGREDEEGEERVCFDGTLLSAAAVVRGRHKGAGGKGEKGSGEEEEAEEEGGGWWEQWAGGEGGRPFGGNVVWMVYLPRRSPHSLLASNFRHPPSSTFPHSPPFFPPRTPSPLPSSPRPIPSLPGRWVAARNRRRRLFVGLVRRAGGGGRQQQVEGVRARQQQQLDEAVAAAAASPTSTTTASATAATTTARSTARHAR